MVFWKKLFSLKPKYYIFTMGNVFSLVFWAQFYFQYREHGFTSTYELMLMIMLYEMIIINSIATPWVRLWIVKDLNHYVADIVAEIKLRIQTGREAYERTPLTTLLIPEWYTSYGFVYRIGYNDEDKRAARSNEHIKILIKVVLTFIKMFVLDLLCWVLSPILIWFALNKKTIGRAEDKGYLRAAVKIPRRQISILSNLPNLFLFLAIEFLMVGAFLNFTYGNTYFLVRNTGEKYAPGIVKEYVVKYGQKYGLPDSILQKTITESEAQNITAKTLELGIKGETLSPIADDIFNIVNKNLNQSIDTQSNSQYVDKKNKFINNYKKELKSSELYKPLSKEEKQGLAIFNIPRKISNKFMLISLCSFMLTLLFSFIAIRKKIETYSELGIDLSITNGSVGIVGLVLTLLSRYGNGFKALKKMEPNSVQFLSQAMRVIIVLYVLVILLAVLLFVISKHKRNYKREHVVNTFEEEI